MKATEGALSAGTPDGSAIAQYGLDPDFRANWAASKEAGLVRGAYHFGRPDLGNSPEGEASWFWSVVGASLQPGDLIALDLESGGGSLAVWAARFLGYLKARAGFNPLLYASPNFLATRGITFRNVGGDYGLWEADWVATEPAPAAGWPVLAIWQYGSGGHLAGIAGRVDGDVFNGDRATLLKYGKPGLAGAGSGSITPPPPPVYEALTDKGTPIASGPDEAAIEASAVSWQQANLTEGATITKDGKPYKTLAPIPRPVGKPLPDPNEGNKPVLPPLPKPTNGGKTVDPQTQKDAGAFMRLLAALFGTGPDGIEQGFGTSEFWLMVLALAADFGGPYLGIVHQLSPDFQVAFAGLLASAYVAFRSWRKRGGRLPGADLYDATLAALKRYASGK